MFGHTGGTLQFNIFGCYSFFWWSNTSRVWELSNGSCFHGTVASDTNAQEALKHRARETHRNALTELCTRSIAVKQSSNTRNTRHRTDCNLWQTTANQQQQKIVYVELSRRQRPRKCNITEFHCEFQLVFAEENYLLQKIAAWVPVLIYCSTALVPAELAQCGETLNKCELQFRMS